MRTATLKPEVHRERAGELNVFMREARHVQRSTVATGQFKAHTDKVADPNVFLCKARYVKQSTVAGRPVDSSAHEKGRVTHTSS